MNQFKSIHIDLDEGIYEINGDPAGTITELNLEWDSENGWALTVSRDETYITPIFPARKTTE